MEARYKGEIIQVFEGIAIIRNADNPIEIIKNSGMLKEIGILHSILEADTDKIVGELEKLSTTGLRFKKINIRKFKNYSCHINPKDLKLTSLSGGDRVLRVFITEGIAVIGEVLAEQDTKAFNSRRPGRRPFFKPGPLSPQLSRVFVNLARLKEGDVYLDPFCGTGGFVLEACLLGARHCICGDLSSDMIRGSLINIKYFNFNDKVSFFWQDSAYIPLKEETVDTIATDPPYGRSTTTGKRAYDELVEKFLHESYRVLKKGGHIVYAGPSQYTPWKLAYKVGFRVIARYQMYVHSTLTREIVVARKLGIEQ